jgi:2-keto-4-pentenoate hydratase/2-oxohepta-3-ene-1,7-dioic acid hydratase in catechol pathway
LFLSQRSIDLRIRREKMENEHTLAIHDGRRWVPLAAALEDKRERWPVLVECADDAIAFLAGGSRIRDAARELLEAVADRIFENGAPVLPLSARSLRCFASWEKHWVDAARALARRYHRLARFAITPYEAILGRVFPPLRPGKEFYRHPVYYTGNHLTIIGDGENIPWPSYCNDLDYELELVAVVSRPVRDATAEQARAAIGGFLVFNDCSARDTQWTEHNDGLFGPVVKTKSFASVLGSEVVTADEVLERQQELTGSVTVNGEQWVETATAGMQHPFEEMLSWASRGETIVPGELLSSGTLPGGSGLELDRWIAPGDRLRLEIRGVGEITNIIGPRSRHPLC